MSGIGVVARYCPVDVADLHDDQVVVDTQPTRENPVVEAGNRGDYVCAEKMLRPGNVHRCVAIPPPLTIPDLTTDHVYAAIRPITESIRLPRGRYVSRC